MGFNIVYIEIEHSNRRLGKSSYTYKKLFKLATDTIISFSNKPLKISVYLGFGTAIIATLISVLFLIRKFVFDVPIGWTSIILAIGFFSGIILISLGIIGLYLEKIFNEVKNRPNYIVKETIQI